MNIKGIVFLALLGAPCAVQSQMYKHVDKDGKVTYSNTPLKDAKKHELPPLTVIPPIKPKAAAPKVTGTQDASDVADLEARRKATLGKIFEETKLLEQAKKEYNSGEPEREGGEKNYQKYLDRVQRLKDNIALHEKNIGALRLELQGLSSPNKK